MAHTCDDDVVGPRVRIIGALAREHGDRRPTGRLGAAVCGGHHLAETTRDDGAAALGEQASDLLCGRLVVAAAPDHGHLPRHAPMVCIDGMERRHARGGTLIVGGGFAGAYVARFLGRSGATIVSPDNFMLYTPLLPEAASGTLEPRHVVVPLRRMCPHSELLLGTATALDDEERTRHGRDARWRLRDPLRAARGRGRSGHPRAALPGLAEHGLGFKDVADAIALRNRVLRQLESAAARLDEDGAGRDLGFVFVGAGYAGVEALAELNDLALDAARLIPELRGASQRWVLVDAAPRSCPRSPAGSASYTHARARAARRRDPRGTTLEEFTGAEAVLSNGVRVPARTLVWAAGVRANPVAAALGLPVDGRGRVVVDATLAVDGTPRTSGRSATARRFRTQPRPGGSIRRPASTPSGRPARSRQTSRGHRNRTATACSARSRRWAATKASRTSWAFASAVSPAGS